MNSKFIGLLGSKGILFSEAYLRFSHRHAVRRVPVRVISDVSKKSNIFKEDLSKYKEPKSLKGEIFQISRTIVNPICSNKSEKCVPITKVCDRVIRERDGIILRNKVMRDVS